MMNSGVKIAAQRSTTIEALAPLLDDATPVLGVMDFNIIDQLIELLRDAYPETWILHTVAISDIGLPGALEHVRARGLGAQTASSSELDIAVHSGFTPLDIEHNAAANNRIMLRQLTDVHLNFSVDNVAELARVDALLDGAEQYQAHIGLRIAPQTSRDDGALAISPLGIGLRDHGQDIIVLFKDRPWLNQLTVHFDGPPASLQQAAEQVAAMYQLAEDIEHGAGAQRVHRLHIGGGLPVNFASDDVIPSMANHRFVHQAMIPELFDGKYSLVTDFSHALLAKAGMLLAKVEYTKELDDRLIAVIHADTPFAAAQAQPIRIEAYDAHGDKKDVSELFYYDVAGPAGLVGQRVELPELEEGDVLAILDVGATAFGAHSSLTAPVYGIRSDGLLRETSVLRASRTEGDIAQAAGVYGPEKLLH